MSYGFDMGFAQANSLQEALKIALEYTQSQKWKEGNIPFFVNVAAKAENYTTEVIRAKVHTRGAPFPLD